MSRWLLAAVVVVTTVGCGEELVFTHMRLEPGDTTIWEDDTATFRVTYLDQKGGSMEAPAGGVEWSTNNPRVLRVRDGGVVAPLKHGDGTVTASAVNSEGTPIEASAAVTARQIHKLDVVAYITQVNQHPHELIPLVAGRPGMFRVHAVALERLEYASPDARIRLWNGDRTIVDTILEPGWERILQEVDQSDYRYSYNIEIEGDIVSDGLTASVVFDPNDEERGIRGSDEIRFEVVELDVQNQMLVPVIESHSPNRSVETWVSNHVNNGNMGFKTMTILPIAEQNLVGHAPYETDINWSEDPFAWSKLLRELDMLRRQEEKLDYYYYGVVRPSVGGGPSGIAFDFGHPVSCGLPDIETYIHETGHSMNLRHAPCGGAGGPDPNYPNDTGFLDWWGFDPSTNGLMAPAKWTDFMGYCRDTWISAYHFNRAMEFRLGPGADQADQGPPEPVLLVTGSVYGGVLTVDPVFRAVSSPETGSGGPYLIQGHGPDGRVLFSHRFTPLVPVDLDAGRIFSLAIPVPAGLESITVSGPEGAVAVTRDSHTPTAMLIDENGEVRAIRRNWDGSNPHNWAVSLSTGLPG